MTPSERRYRDRGRHPRQVRVAIAGGGIGGMALALALHDAGCRDVDVYESASSIVELGVGINVLPHATRELAEPDGFADLDAVISREELEVISRDYKRTAGFDPELLNHRPSLRVAQRSAHGRRPAARQDHVSIARRADRRCHRAAMS
jgi:5-methylphenazine-1-carboxylate 1-monooxygenase